MNSTDQKAPGARGVPQPFNRQVGHAPQSNPAVAQLKTALSAQSVKRPVAPPVYRPQATPNAVQPRMANGAVNRRPPVAPPVYRPQQVPKVLQTKGSSSSNRHAGQAPRQPVAPPVYRAEQRRVAQPEIGSAVQRQTRPTAPPVYRPQPKQLTAPATLPLQMKSKGPAPAVHHPRHVRQKIAPLGAGVASSIIQRRVLLDDNEKSWNDISNYPAANGIGDVQEEILKRWVDQRTVHKFYSDNTRTAEARLFTAAAAAEQLLLQGATVNDLFKAENLKFITQTADRKPTLYFMSGNNSGRLRQTHGGGPKIGIEQGKTDLFYSKEEDWRTAYRRMRTLMRNHESPGAVEWKWELATHGRWTAQEGDYHLEVTRNANGVVTSFHPSGGRYSSDISAYDDNWLSENIWGVVGLAVTPNL